MSLLHKKVRVRFAPSPTGFLHIGSFRTALYNYLFVKKHKGEFVLRIEDTDQSRTIKGGVENIIKTLEWFNIKPDEGPHIQSERTKIYKKHVQQLVEQGSAYYCDCSSQRLDKMRKEQMKKKMPPIYDKHCREKNLKQGKVVRLKVPEQGTTMFNDEIRDKVKFENKLIDDAILLKSDGFPTYHLANVVDDHLMKITHVIRGEEWISSTPKHVLLYKAFKWELPVFAHLPLLLNKDKSKLSKRQGDVAVEDYIKKGYLPEALINFVALLGWNPKDDQEIYEIKTLIKHFDLKKVNKGGAIVNFEKLDWLNGHYIRKKSLDDLAKLVFPYLPVKDTKLARKILALEQERMKKLSDITEAAEFFFKEPKYKPNILAWKKMNRKDVHARLESLLSFLWEYGKDWNAKELEKQIKQWIEQQELKNGEILWPMRVALSGREASPGPFDIAAILGKEKTLKRIEYATKLAKKL